MYLKLLIFFIKDESMLFCGWFVGRFVGCLVSILRFIILKFVIGVYKGWLWYIDDVYWIIG